MTFLRVLMAVLGIAFFASFFWAAPQKGFWDSVDNLTGDPWGIVTILDLYLGFIFAAIVIWYAEGRKLISLLWIVPIFFLGNLIVAAWAAIRLPVLVKPLLDRA